MLSQQQQTIIIETLKPFNPTFIGLCGSYARNEETEKSDIDIVYEFNNPTFSLFDLGGLNEDLSQKLNRQVDLVSKQHIKSYFKTYIETDIIVLFEKQQIIMH